VTVLSVNINKIAWLRNSREGGSPDVAWAASTALDAGAHGITVHPRPDQRHIRPRDVYQLAELLANRSGIEFNIEGNPFAGIRDASPLPDYPGFDALIESTRPDQATLVPDSDDQLTSDHGWDLSGDNVRLSETIERYHQWGARVSLFMDPDLKQIEQAQAVGADRIELYTGPFADIAAQAGLENEQTGIVFERYLSAARYANQLGLGVNAGHDLDLDNLILFRTIEEVAEVSIGHALITDALRMGLASAVSAYLEVLGH
jgi:pyridoxine 5-phosphate synthase